MQERFKRDMSGPKRDLIRGTVLGGGAAVVGAGAFMIRASADTQHIVLAGAVAVAAAALGARLAKRGYRQYVMHFAEQRALGALRRHLRADWQFDATFVAGAPVAILTPPEGAPRIVMVRALTQVRVERGIMSLGKKRLRFIGANEGSAFLAAENAGLSLGGLPVLWYPGAHGKSDVLECQIPVAIGKAAKLLEVLGARKAGLLF